MIPNPEKIVDELLSMKLRSRTQAHIVCNAVQIIRDLHGTVLRQRRSLQELQSKCAKESNNPDLPRP